LKVFKVYKVMVEKI